MKIRTLFVVSLLAGFGPSAFAAPKYMAKSDSGFKEVTAPVIGAWTGMKIQDAVFKSVDLKLDWNDAVDSDKQRFTMTFVASPETIAKYQSDWIKSNEGLKSVTSYTIRLEGVWRIDGRGRDGKIPFLYLKDIGGAVKIEGEGDLVGINSKENGKLKANLTAKESGDNLRGMAFGFVAAKMTQTEDYFFPRLNGFQDFDFKLDGDSLDLTDHDKDRKIAYKLARVK